MPTLAPHIMYVETIDQLTKGEILALARKFFEAKDRMTPQLTPYPKGSRLAVAHDTVKIPRVALAGTDIVYKASDGEHVN